MGEKGMIKAFFSAMKDKFNARNVPFEFIKRDGGVAIIGYKQSLTPRCEIPSQILGLPVKSIEARTFTGCAFLYEVWVRDGIEVIGANAFSGCESLTQIHIGGSVKEIDRNAFFECEHLFGADLPDGLKKLGDRAFFGCTGLRDIVLPDSLEEIGEQAFCGCKTLKSVKLPINLKTVYRNSFENCPELSEVFVERDSPADKILSQSGYYAKILRYIPRI